VNLSSGGVLRRKGGRGVVNFEAPRLHVGGIVEDLARVYASHSKKSRVNPGEGRRDKKVGGCAESACGSHTKRKHDCRCPGGKGILKEKKGEDSQSGSVGRSRPGTTRKKNEASDGDEKGVWGNRNRQDF